MSSKYEQGTVAIATVNGEPGVRIALADEPDHSVPWFALTGRCAGDWLGVDEVTDVRPLVVLDLDEIAAPNETCGEPAGPEIANCLRKLAEGDHRDSWRGRVARRIADQIEAQTKPPRIPEPGLCGVVEARVESRGAEQGRFVRDDRDDRYWECIDWPGTYCWSDPIDPVLTRPGIEDES